GGLLQADDVLQGAGQLAEQGAEEDVALERDREVAEGGVYGWRVSHVRRFLSAWRPAARRRGATVGATGLRGRGSGGCEWSSVGRSVRPAGGSLRWGVRPTWLSARRLP